MFRLRPRFAIACLREMPSGRGPEVCGRRGPDGPARQQQLVIVEAETARQAVIASAQAQVPLLRREGRHCGRARRGPRQGRWRGGDSRCSRDCAGPPALQVRVRKGGTSSNWCYRNNGHAVLTRLGWQSGACHGAPAAARGGIKRVAPRLRPRHRSELRYDRKAPRRRIDRRSIRRRRACCCSSRPWFVPTRRAEDRRRSPVEYASSRVDRLGSPWPEQGRPGQIRRLRCCPPRGALTAEDTLINARASVVFDGSARTSTRWSKFNSSEDLVARRVGPRGR